MSRSTFRLTMKRPITVSCLRTDFLPAPCTRSLTGVSLGKARREQVDFGYWYCPDGRDAMTQSQFEDVEVKPQAFEWLFCVAAGFPFNVSCDNLDGDVEPDRIAFQRRVHARVMTLLEQGIPERPARFIRALQHYYQTPPLTAKHFPWPEDLH